MVVDNTQYMNVANGISICVHDIEQKVVWMFNDATCIPCASSPAVLRLIAGNATMTFHYEFTDKHRGNGPIIVTYESAFANVSHFFFITLVANVEWLNVVHYKLLSQKYNADSVIDRLCQQLNIITSYRLRSLIDEDVGWVFRSRNCDVAGNNVESISRTNQL